MYSPPKLKSFSHFGVDGHLKMTGLHVVLQQTLSQCVSTIMTEYTPGDFQNLVNSFAVLSYVSSNFMRIHPCLFCNKRTNVAQNITHPNLWQR